MKRCLLFSGGPLDDCDRVSLDDRWCEPEVLTVACDGGLYIAAHYQIVPALAVGDFDSFSGEIPTGTQTVRANPYKDETDTMLGLMTAIERGCSEFLLVGGFGGRLDHTIGNLQLLSWLSARGLSGEIRSNHARAWAVKNGTLRLNCAGIERYYLSVFAWDGVCDGVTLEGLEYPLSDARLMPTLPIGVSNRFSSGEARVTVKRGTLLVMAVEET